MPPATRSISAHSLPPTSQSWWGSRQTRQSALQSFASDWPIGDLSRPAVRSLPPLSWSEFLSIWQFVNRETGEVSSFNNNLWDGQQMLAAAMMEHPWLYALKAGKLGFTELACAWDAWRALYGGANARVHLFSMGQRESRDLLQYIRFGLNHLPEAYRPVGLEQPEAGTLEMLRWRMGSDDVRTIVSYPASEHISIDQSCIHAHVDELAHMRFPRETWDAVSTTIAPNGTCHIVTRGQRGYAAELWEQITAAPSRLHPLFVPYDQRPGRDTAWREAETRLRTTAGIAHYAPRTPEEALRGDYHGLVFPMFDPPRHLRKTPCGWTEYRRRYGAVDLGGGDPQAVLSAGVCKDGTLQFHALSYWPGGSGMTVDDAINAAWQMHKQAPYSALIIDPPIKSIIDHFRAVGLPAYGREGAKYDGLQEVATWLETGKMFYDTSMADQVVREYQSYSWREAVDPHSQERYATSTPVDHHAETLDCTRMIVMRLMAEVIAGGQTVRRYRVPPRRPLVGVSKAW